MRLARQTKNGWRYQLNEEEAICLRSLLDQFPITPNATVKMSRTDGSPQAATREKLLNESLAEHRKELQKQADSLMAADNLKPQDEGWLLCLNSEKREILLQILNDIRIGSWRALGELEDLESETPYSTERERMLYNLMHAAGFFEHELLNLEAAAKPT